MTAALLPQRSRKTISLTALIDVVFILLMFFMLTSSFTQWRAIALNPATATSDAAESKPALIVVDRDGQLLLNATHGEALTPVVLRAQVPPEQAAVLLPRADTPVQTLLDAMNALKQAGFAALTLGESLPTDSDKQ